MRGIRFMKGARTEDARRLWIEWVRLEISFVEKIRKRWEILGIEDKVAAKADLETVLQNGEPGLANSLLEDQTMAADEGFDSKNTRREHTHSAILGGALIEMVITNAAAAFPEDPRLYTNLLSLIRPMPTVLRSTLLSHIYNLLRSNLVSLQPSNGFAVKSAFDCQARVILARRYVDDLVLGQISGKSIQSGSFDSLEWIEAIEEAVKAFQESLNTSPEENTSLLSAEFAAFLHEMRRKTDDASLVK